MELTLKSQHEWRTDPLYAQYFHESGMMNIEGTRHGRRMIQNYKDLGVATQAAVVRPEELKKRYPLFRDTDYSEAKDCYINPQSEWAEEASDVKTVIETAVDEGVEYVQSTIIKLLLTNGEIALVLSLMVEEPWTHLTSFFRWKPELQG